MIQKTLKKCWKPVSFLLIAVFIFSPTQPAQSSSINLQSPPPLTAEELANFFDSFIPSEMETFNLPGVVVAVVADGKLTYAQGYGFADVENQIPVKPEITLFDVGSVTKLFTFTAVMQLVQSGDLDLEEDVNQYLTTFKIPDAFNSPITVANLLTHTAGFDEWDIGAAARTADKVLPVCEYLEFRLPPRVRPPGELITYSNHGSALAGCLVEEVTGLPFAVYVERYIFLPLEMTHSTFLWPVELLNDMAVGYEPTKDGFMRRDIYYRHFGPAGELKTTATDISRFMIAHLQAGRFGDVHILKPEIARLMQSQQFTHHPLLPGMTYGFFEDQLNDRHALVHGGDTNPIFSSLVVLLPEEGVGLFIAHNTAEYHFRDALLNAFMDRYFPTETSTRIPTGMQGYAERADRFTGLYQPTFLTRETSLEKILTAFTQFKITADSTGILTTHEPSQLADDSDAKWIEVEPLVFNSLDSNHKLVFVEDETGKIIYMATSLFPGSAFLPVPWYETPTFNLGLLIGCLVLFLSGMLRWFWGRKVNPFLWHLTAAVALLNTVFIIGLVVMLQVLALDAIFGLPVWASLLLALPLVSFLLSLVGLGKFILAYDHKNREQNPGLHALLVLLAGQAFFWQIFYWNLTIL